MSAEPITLFSHKIDPKCVLDVLRAMAPGLTVEGPEDDWQRITVSGPKRLLRKTPTITLTHDRAYYAGDDWGDQVRGMIGYFSRFPGAELTPRIVHLIESFRFALGVLSEPEIDIDSADERLKYLFAAAKHLDAALFTPSSLRDASGRVLFHAKREPDPSAQMPAIYREVPGLPRQQRTRSQGGTLPDPDSPPPPTPRRVARRALALAAVSGRALLEQEDAADPGVEETRRRILEWVDATGIGDELEPEEWKVIQRPLGALARQDALNATWRLEGLGVLAWALNRYALRPHDELVDPGELLPAIAMLNVEKARALLAEPDLRARGELEKLGERLFALHWRLREFQVRPGPKNFRELARTAWWGEMNIEGLPLIDDDLAVGGPSITNADPDAVGAAMSATAERHLAINWLRGYAERYSEVDTPT